MPIDEYDALLDDVLPKPRSVSRPARPGVTRFQPNTDWSLDKLPEVESAFQQSTGKSLPISVRGQGSIHRKWGLQHQNSADVGVRPGTPEGQALEKVLRERNVPFLAFDRAIPGVATGPHFHIGRPSHRGPSSSSPAPQKQPRDEYDSLLDEVLPTAQPARRVARPQRPADPFAGITAGVKGVSVPASPYDINKILARPQTREPTFEEDRIQRARQRGGKNLRMAEDESVAQLKRVRQQIASEPNRRAEARLFEPKLSDEEEVLRRMSEEKSQMEAAAQAQARSVTPEMIAARKDFGSQPAVVRALTQPGGRAGAGLLKGLGGIASAAGLAPNVLSEYLNKRGQFLEESTTHAPLTPEGSEIERQLPEKALSAVTDLGFGIAELIALKKATGLSMPNIMAAETALKTNDLGAEERFQRVTEAYAMGTLLDQHLSRPAAAVAFGAPTAIQTGEAYSKGQMSSEDALLQTAIQAGTGAVLGGKPKGRRVRVTERIEDAQRVSGENRDTARSGQVSKGVSRVGLEQPNVASGTISEGRTVSGSDVLRSARTVGEPQRFQHLQFGEVTAAENQAGVGQGRVRVVDTAGTEHVIQKPNQRGAGNERAIPIKSEVPPAVEAAERRQVRREFDKIKESAEAAPTEPARRETPELQSEAVSPARLAAPASESTRTAIPPSESREKEQSVRLREIANEAWQKFQAAGDTIDEARLVKEYFHAENKAEIAEAQDYFAGGGKYINEQERAAILDERTPIEEYTKNKDALIFSALKDHYPDGFSAAPTEPLVEPKLKGVINETTALESGAEKLKTVTPGKAEAAPNKPITTSAEPSTTRQRKRGDTLITGERSDITLSQFVRKRGGIAPGEMFKGELDRLRTKESGTTGLVNQKNKTGSQRMTADYMREAAEEAGFGPFESATDFIAAVERDAAGQKIQALTGAEIDFAKEHRKHAEIEIADERQRLAVERSADALATLLEAESGRPGELFDRIVANEASDAEIREFRSLARKRFIRNSDIDDLIREAQAEDVSTAFEGQPETSRSAQQLGFIEEGLTQQSAPPPKEVDQRARLIQEEKTRQETANPERAAALKTLAELKAKGMTVADYAKQGSLLGDAPTREKLALLRELEEPSLVRSARERQAKRVSEKQQGIEYRRSGADPYELIDNLTIKGWDLYSQKVKPTFEEWSRKLREEFGPESDSHLRKIWTQLGGIEPSSTAAKREKVTSDRVARGEEPIARPERKSDEKLLADAKEANTKDPNEPLRLVDQVLNGKKGALSDKETVQLDLHVQELKNKYDVVNKQLVEAKDPATIKDLSEKSDAMEREMRAAEEAFAASGTEKGRALRAQRIEIDQDFRLLTVVAGRKKALGRDLTRNERQQVQEWASKYAELEVKLAESTARAEKAEAERAIVKLKAETVRENRRAGRGLKRESLDQEAAELKALIAQAWKKQSGAGSTVQPLMGLAKLDPEGVVTKLVVRLARNRVEAKIGLKAEALIDEVHGLLKDAVDLTRRDVAEMISGYGKTFEMSKDVVDIRLRELKSIIASNLGKADIIEKGIRPLRRGLQRDKPTQEVRAAMRELRDTLREHGMQVERSKGSPEEQQKSALDAAKTRTRNRIEDLTKWIADGKRTVANKTEIIADPELQTLKAERDRLQEVFEAIVDPAADAKKIENAIKTVEKSVADLEAKIKAGDIAPKPRSGGLTSPELEAARAEQKALRGILTDLRNAAKPERSDIEIEARKILAANKSMTSRMEKQIADLERRMKQGDFSEKAKRQPVPITRENLVLQKQLEQIKTAYAKANYKATRSRFGQITDELAKAANVPKTLKSMGDISAVFRQGGFYAITHPIKGLAKPSAAMLRSFTETGYRNVEQLIQSHPKFEQAKRDGVEFTGVDKSDPHLSHKEEGFFGGETIDVLATGKYNPLRVVKGVKGFSERTFVSFLDAQRMNMYDIMTEGLKAQGLTPRNAPQSYKGVAKLINVGTGRGNLGKRGNQAAPFLNILMFSPRLVVSRAQMLNNMFNPFAMARKPKGVRAQNIKDNVKFLAATAAFIGLATAAGGTVNFDPDDADFLKIRFGRTTYDTLTGLQQPMRYIVNMGRAATGGETYPGQSMTDLTTRFARSKASPLAGLAVDAITGEDFMGRKFSAKRAATDVVTPLPVRDFAEAMEKEGLIKGFIKATPALTGIGVQTYNDRPGKPVTHAEKLARKFLHDKMPDVARDEEQIEKDDKKAELRDRSRKGEDVKAELDKLDLTERQRKTILEAKGQTRLQEDFKRLGLKEALTVYGVMTRGQREQVREILAKKAENVENLTEGEQETMRGKLKDIGLVVPPSRPKRPQRPTRPSRGSRGGAQWVTP